MWFIRQTWNSFVLPVREKGFTSRCYRVSQPVLSASHTHRALRWRRNFHYHNCAPVISNQSTCTKSVFANFQTKRQKATLPNTVGGGCSFFSVSINLVLFHLVNDVTPLFRWLNMLLNSPCSPRATMGITLFQSYFPISKTSQSCYPSAFRSSGVKHPHRKQWALCFLQLYSSL